MLDISQQKAGQRWDTITPQLREALFSDVNADFVWNLCQNEHLTEEKSYQVAEISGYVLLGFLHPEDLAGELVSSIDLPTPLAKTISDQINSRVFAPLRADIDKVYSPLSKLTAAPSDSNPKILQDIGISPKHDAMPSVPKPTTLSDVGWSKQPAAIPTPSAAPIAPKPAAAPTAMPAEPAPMMLHEDTAFKPAEKNASFTIPKAGGTAEMGMGGVISKAPARPAVLEFGTVPVPKPTASQPPMPRYSEFKPSLASTPVANSGPRNINQIAPITPVSVPVPKPTIAIPIPKPPAQISQLPTPLQPNKPIVKDFL